MKLDEIREMALDRGFTVSGRSKRDVIRQFQRAEGNFPCFATAANGECDQFECLWRGECLAALGQPSKSRSAAREVLEEA